MNANHEAWKEREVRQAARTDGNQGVIVEALRKAGCTVQSLAAVGQGVPDLLVGVAGRTFLVEVKDPSQPPSKRRLTPDQLQWHEGWKGSRVHVVETIEQALHVAAFAAGRITRACL